MSDAINPMANFQQGFGIGQAVQQNMLNAQAMRQAEAAAAAEAARQQEYQKLFNIAMRPGASNQDWYNLIANTPEDQLEPIKLAYESMSADEQKNTQQLYGEIIAASRAGARGWGAPAGGGAPR